MNRILKEAARMIAEGEQRFSCSAVIFAAIGAGKNTFEIYHVFEDKYALSISPTSRRCVIPRDFEENPVHNTPAAIEHRVIALLMVGEAWDDLD